VSRRRRNGEQIIHLGFGEAGLPVHPMLREVMGSASHLNSYDPVTGNASLRREIAGWFTRRGLATDQGDVIATPGSKAVLFGLLLALPGDLVLAQPSWVSYAPQAGLLGKRVIRRPAPRDAEGIPDPATFAQTLSSIAAPAMIPGF
jgi:aspartate aminotransferase